MSNAPEKPQPSPQGAGEEASAVPDAPRRPQALMRPDERGIAVLCHLSNLVPLWALVANALLHFLYRESSRAVCFHARQGIHFHILLLLVSVPMSLLVPLEGLLRHARVRAALVEYLPSAGMIILAATYAVYAACCLVGAVQALRGRTFAYPLIGRTLYQNYFPENRGDS